MRRATFGLIWMILSLAVTSVAGESSIFLTNPLLKGVGQAVPGTPSPMGKRPAHPAPGVIDPFRPMTPVKPSPDALPGQPDIPTLKKLLEGGDWESSGGTGVACFQDENALRRFDLARAQERPLTDQEVADISTLETLEHWERKDQKYPTDLEADAILKRLSRRLKVGASIFWFQLELVSSRIHTGAWRPEGQLQSTHDALPFKPLAANCRLIQLAVRLSHRVSIDRMPELHVFFDPRLMAKLDPLNRAMLELHEKIYVIARQVGHPDARRTRLLVSRLLDDDFWKLGTEKPTQMAMKVQSNLDFQLGDYIHIFFTLVPDAASPKPLSPSSRLVALRDVVGKLRAHLNRCAGEQGDSSDEAYRESRSLCHSMARSSDAFTDSLSDEEAYVFLYRWVLTPAVDGILSVEVNMIDWQDQEFRNLSKTSLRTSCDLVNQAIASGYRPAKGFQAARRHCDELIRSGAFTPNP